MPLARKVNGFSPPDR